MRIRLTFAAAALALAAGAASAQQPPAAVRMTGVVKAVSATALTLTTAKGDEEIALTPKTRVLTRQAATAADLKPGAYLGTSNQNSPDGAAGTATEVHLMDNGPNVHFPMNNAGLMMTNGHVKSVKTTPKGEEIDVDYGQAAPRHVVVTKDTALTRMVDLGPAGLKAGEQITANTTAGADGKPTASFILVGAPPAASK